MLENIGSKGKRSRAGCKKDKSKCVGARTTKQHARRPQINSNRNLSKGEDASSQPREVVARAECAFRCLVEATMAIYNARSKKAASKLQDRRTNVINNKHDRIVL
jgi:hypothetical protein